MQAKRYFSKPFSKPDGGKVITKLDMLRKELEQATDIASLLRLEMKLLQLVRQIGNEGTQANAVGIFGKEQPAAKS